MAPITLLHNQRIILGVTGSIAVYKVVDLASKLTQAGALVDVIMTEAAQKFVTPLTFQAITGRPVYTDLWQTDSTGGLPTHIAHVGLAEDAALLAVIPATAHTIGKLAHGLGDDMLTVTALAARCPLVIAPASDGNMYHHPAVHDNLKTLIARGAYLIEPEVGRFASGHTGKGRLPDTATLIGHLRRARGQQVGLLSGRHVVITAGGTREAIDPVRYVSNHSSGKQGYALAQAAVDAGANVTLISTVNLPAPVGAEVVPVTSALEMQAAVLKHSAQSDALIMAAAVADFRPAQVAEQKIKKTDDTEGLTIELTRNPDILLSVREQRAAEGRPLVVVGFAAESEHLEENAQGKLERKGLDLMVANDITAKDAGFATDTNRVVLLAPHEPPTRLDLMGKDRVSEEIIVRVVRVLEKRW